MVLLLAPPILRAALLIVVVLLGFQRDRAAALATACRIEIKKHAGFHDLVQNEALGMSYRTVCEQSLTRCLLLSFSLFAFHLILIAHSS